MVLDWQRRRSEFNHDWLKNRYLNNLDGFIANLEMKKPDVSRLMIFLDEDWNQWKPKEEEARRLMDSFEKEMSPLVLFESGILKRMNPESQKWIKPLTHQLWLNNHDIKNKISNCEEWFLKVTAQYDKINSMLDEKKRNIEQLKNLLPEFKAFRETCRAFSQSISKLPSKVLVP
jgi:DNA repair exonuclease SbcCD ATPase subunit